MRTKLRIFNYNSNVKSILLYGCETWRTTQTMQQKIQTSFLASPLPSVKQVLVSGIADFSWPSSKSLVDGPREIINAKHNHLPKRNHQRQTQPPAQEKSSTPDTTTCPREIIKAKHNHLPKRNHQSQTQPPAQEKSSKPDTTTCPREIIKARHNHLPKRNHQSQTQPPAQEKSSTPNTTTCPREIIKAKHSHLPKRNHQRQTQPPA